MWMSDGVRIAIQMALVPLIWLALSRFASGPMTRFAFRYLSYRIARMLTKKRFEG